jgi:hypothetical protein
MALKMDGAKPAADTSGHNAMRCDSVGGRPSWAEAGLQSPVDRLGLKIPVVVTAKRGENPLRRKGQGSPATRRQLGVSRS